MPPVKDLQRLVLDRLSELGDRDGSLSLRSAAERSGGMVSHSTLQRISAGQYLVRKITDRTIKGIALALDVRESEVRAAAGRSQIQPPTEFVLPKRARELTVEQRRALIAVMDSMLTSRRSEQPSSNHRER